MDCLQAIKNRRSVRIFKNDKIPTKIIEQILETTIYAPSGKNSQPWRFIVLENEKKGELEDLLKHDFEIFKENNISTGTFKRSIWCISKAPIVILVFNANSNSYKNNDNYLENIVDIQSIGGAIQTMLITAYSLDIGTLCVGDILYAEKSIKNWLNTTNDLISAVILGYADEEPNARPRNKWTDVTIW